MAERGVEVDHATIMRWVQTLKGIEIMHMIKKGQVDTLNQCVSVEVNFVNQLFGIAA